MWPNQEGRKRREWGYPPLSDLDRSGAACPNGCESSNKSVSREILIQWRNQRLWFYRVISGHPLQFPKHYYLLRLVFQSTTRYRRESQNLEYRISVHGLPILTRPVFVGQVSLTRVLNHEAEELRGVCGRREASASFKLDFTISESIMATLEEAVR